MLTPILGPSSYLIYILWMHEISIHRNNSHDLHRVITHSLVLVISYARYHFTVLCYLTPISLSSLFVWQAHSSSDNTSPFDSMDDKTLYWRWVVLICLTNSFPVQLDMTNIFNKRYLLVCFCLWRSNTV